MVLSRSQYGHGGGWIMRVESSILPCRGLRLSLPSSPTQSGEALIRSKGLSLHLNGRRRKPAGLTFTEVGTLPAWRFNHAEEISISEIETAIQRGTLLSAI